MLKNSWFCSRTAAPRKQVSIASSSLVVLFAVTACDGGETGASDADAGPTEDGSAISCDGEAVGETQRRTRYQSAAVAAGELCSAQEQTRRCEADGNWSAWTGNYTSETCSVEGYLDCAGQPHGTLQTRDFYERERVPFGETCAKQTQTRSCDDGSWSEWSGSFSFERCTVDGALSCGQVPHGESQQQTRYETAQVPFGSTCQSEIQGRTCSLGAWSQWTGTFTHESCQVLGALSCGNSPHGATETRTRYQEALVEADEACAPEEQQRTCNNGAWGDWLGSFEHVICDVNGERRCGDVMHGEKARRTRYEDATVPFGAECTEEEQESTCADGTLGDWSGSFEEEACEVGLPSDCASIKHNATTMRTRFQAASVPYGASCAEEIQVSLCYNGIIGDWSGTFTYETCSPLPPVDCADGAHGAKKSQERYQSATVPYGSTCVLESQESTCINGTWTEWSGSYVAESCVVLPPPDCVGGVHGASEQRTRYRAAVVAAGSSCESELQTRTCNAGNWNGWTGTFAHETCRVAGQSCTDVLTQETVMDGSSQARVRYAEGFPSGACNPETQTRLCTNGIFGSWSGTFVVQGCGPIPNASANVASCRITTADLSQCLEYRGVDLAGYQAQCASGTWDSTRGCPTGGSAWGRCSYDLGIVTQSLYHYAHVSFDPKNHCSLTGGTWTDF